MQTNTNTTGYDFEKSLYRIDEILDGRDTSYKQIDYIPSRNELTFKNGVYVKCSALFVDMRNSSELPDKHKRPTLAKIYRSYISEIVAIMNSNFLCKEIEIDGDCISGIYDTRYKSSINSVFNDSAKINSLIKTLNCKYKKNSITTIKAGIGIDYGRALMIKAGYSGSGLNKIVWMGEVLNDASKLCNMANKDGNKSLLVSETIYGNLNEHNKGFLNKKWLKDYYEGDIININMAE